MTPIHLKTWISQCVTVLYVSVIFNVPTGCDTLIFADFHVRLALGCVVTENCTVIVLLCIQAPNMHKNHPLSHKNEGSTPVVIWKLRLIFYLMYVKINIWKCPEKLEMGNEFKEMETLTGYTHTFHGWSWLYSWYNCIYSRSEPQIL